MGTTVEVMVLGGPRDSTGRARRVAIDELEAKWSRFRPSSELSRLNEAGGAPDRRVGADVRRDPRGGRGVAHHRGSFDPTILRSLEAIGYDRDFASVERHGPALRSRKRRSPGCAGIELDPIVSAVRLPPRSRVDLGGIGKGLAADLVAGALVEAGAEGVLVNLGGDARVAGRPPRPEGWIIECENPLAAGSRARSASRAGAVCTSTRVRRSVEPGPPAACTT